MHFHLSAIASCAQLRWPSVGCRPATFLDRIWRSNCRRNLDRRSIGPMTTPWVLGGMHFLLCLHTRRMCWVGRGLYPGSWTWRTGSSGGHRNSKLVRNRCGNRCRDPNEGIPKISLGHHCSSVRMKCHCQQWLLKCFTLRRCSMRQGCTDESAQRYSCRAAVSTKLSCFPWLGTIREGSPFLHTSPNRSHQKSFWFYFHTSWRWRRICVHRWHHFAEACW